MDQGERQRRNETGYAEDKTCQQLVAKYPNGMSYYQIARYLGITEEEAEELCLAAVAKVAERIGF